MKYLLLLIFCLSLFGCLATTKSQEELRFAIEKEIDKNKQNDSKTAQVVRDVASVVVEAHPEQNSALRVSEGATIHANQMDVEARSSTQLPKSKSLFEDPMLLSILGALLGGGGFGGAKAFSTIRSIKKDAGMLAQMPPQQAKRKMKQMGYC